MGERKEEISSTRCRGIAVELEDEFEIQEGGLRSEDQSEGCKIEIKNERWK